MTSKERTRKLPGTKNQFGNSRRKPKVKSEKDKDEVIHLINKASQKPVLSAYSRLGPIKNYSDLLINNSTDHCEVLAGEHIIHMVECWRYLSSAMYAYLNNEEQHAIHLGYYAELRAVLSLYAGSGIQANKNYEKNEPPYWIDEDGNKNSLKNKIKTHDFAWEVWKKWTARSDAKDLLLNSIFLQPGVSLNNFIPHLCLFKPDALLKTWGYDLLKLNEDHLARNIASYQAYWGKSPLTRMRRDQIEFAQELARLFTKAETGLLFDKMLILYLIHGTLNSQVGEEEMESADLLQTKSLKELIAGVARSSGIDENSLKSHLEVSSLKAFNIFDKAKQGEVHIENILARAAFLARLAMLSVNKNVASSGNQNVKFWVQHWLEHCGCWVPNDEVEPEDLETDYREAIDEFSSGKFKNMPADLWNRENVYTTLVIANPHMCIAWGLVI